MATPKTTTKTTSTVHAVLTADFHYTSHGGEQVIKKGHVFYPWKRNSNCYIARKTHDLVLQHWVQYGDSTTIPPSGYRLVEVTTTTTSTSTSKPYVL